VTTRNARIALAVGLTIMLTAALVIVGQSMWKQTNRIHIVAYFDNSNGLFVGDEVRILGVPVGAVDHIEPQPMRSKISFWIDGKYKVPADAKAAILAPMLVTARAIQLTPVYTAGPVMADGAVIAEDRTAVPVEWDDLRKQLEKLTETLQPNEPGGVSTLGAFINTAAGNLRGEGANIRDSLIKLSQAFSVLGDHSGDIFGTVRNLSVLTSALHTSDDLLRQLNRNLAAVTELLADDPHAVGRAVDDLNTTLGDVREFVADNRESIGTTSDKASAVSNAIVDSIDDIKQLLHVVPTVAQNFSNVYQPAQAALSGALEITNFDNPIQFVCGAIQAASRLGAEQSAKLCVQYLAPIVKNRQYNSLPFGLNPIVGASARPNEVTYSEDWMRPDYVPPQSAAPLAATPAPDVAPGQPLPIGPPLPAESATSIDPASGLTGLMVPPGVGP
jgi:phospholipid/cholesterol/gamma-HCH transport system substrate-binding protein